LAAAVLFDVADELTIIVTDCPISADRRPTLQQQQPVMLMPGKD